MKNNFVIRIIRNNKSFSLPLWVLCIFLVPALCFGSDAIVVGQLMRKIHSVNQVEIKAGELGKAKGTDERVKKFSQHLINDHINADLKLSTLAEQRKVKIDPVSMTAQEEKMVKNLENAEASKFDAVFVAEMAKAHKELIKELELQLKHLDKKNQEDISSYIKETLPVLKSHLQEAEGMNL